MVINCLSCWGKGKNCWKLPEVEAANEEAAMPGRQYELPWGNACPVLDPWGEGTCDLIRMSFGS